MKETVMMYGTVMVLAMICGQSDMNSTPQDFQEFGKLMVGRWSGDITLIADWPGMKKKAGEKLINYSTVQWAADGRAFINTAVGGETTGIGFWTFDPVAKQIRLRAIDSAGVAIDAVVWKEDSTKWGVKITGGGLPDGTKEEGAGHFLFKDGGRSYMVEADITLGGKPLLKLHDTYVKLTP
jgi:hypothetical protein